MRSIVLSLALLAWSCVAAAQSQVEIAGVEECSVIINMPSYVLYENALVLPRGEKPLVQSAALIEITGLDGFEASQVTIRASTQDRQRLQVLPAPESGKYYVVPASGMVWVDVRALSVTIGDDGEVNIVNIDEELTFQVSEDEPDEDEDDGGNDDDGGDDDDPAPPDVDVPNEYGVGKVAYEHAPRGPPSVTDQYIRIYKEAGDFLYGRPSLKFIHSDNSAHMNDPKRSIGAWMRQEIEKIDHQSEQWRLEWAEWRDRVGDATTESQRGRTFQVQDWYSCFQETAKALEISKQ